MIKLITAVEPLEKGRRAIYINGELAFVLYRCELARFKLNAGDEADEELLSRIEGEVLLPRAEKRVLYLLQKKDYTRHELEEKLRAGKYPQEVIDGAIDYAESFGYVDDADYARRFLECYMGRMSEGRIRQKLMQKGLSREELEEAFEHYRKEHPDKEEEERELILKLLNNRHYDPETADPKEKQKQYAFLMRRGFKSSDILSALKGA
ncbi:MAG: regulatory protein RecX [Lachnospiraceae bacterium]|nr:regulatory protein RecX [Lachnospiraceae bacterium]